MGCLISLPVYQITLAEINDDISENYLCFQEFENEYMYSLFILND